MTRDELLRLIRKKAKQDRLRRRDRRFLETMGFLVAKGFLRTNLDLPLLPNKRLRVDDAIWAGRNVEPRILEVLPAAVLRLGKHFDLNPVRHEDLARVVNQLRKRQVTGDDYRGVPYGKLKIWTDLPLPDRRVKSAAEKKVVKTFRLDPRALERLREEAESRSCTETEVIEKLLLESG